MVCVRCGREIVEDAAFCHYCGASQQPAAPRAAQRAPLRRSQLDRQLAGVCGGIARYLSVDPVLVRVAWVVLSIVPGTIFLGVLAYLVAWLIVPDAEPGSEDVDVGAHVAHTPRRRLQRSSTDATLAGVCAMFLKAENHADFSLLVEARPMPAHSIASSAGARRARSSAARCRQNARAV